MDLNENYLFRKKSEYVVRLLKKSGYSLKLLGQRGFSDVFESLLSNTEYADLDEQFDNLRRVDQKGKRELRLKLIKKIEFA